MKVIGITGLPGSGKSEFTRIAQEHGIPVIIMGDVIRKAVMDAGMDPSDDNMGTMATRLRRDWGMDAIARRCLVEIRKQKAKLVIVDGIRGDAEVRAFRESLPEFVLVAIDAPFALRLARLKSRGRTDDTITEASLCARDDRELGWGLGNALSQADYRISNDGNLAVFAGLVTGLLRRLETEP
jgi:dephospho-CoA kinase